MLLRSSTLAHGPEADIPAIAGVMCHAPKLLLCRLDSILSRSSRQSMKARSAD
jgi:hypothetical protein